MCIRDSYKEICKERRIDPHAKAEPETAPIEQPADAAQVSDTEPTGNLTYYVAECMEFPNLGEYHLSLIHIWFHCFGCGADGDVIDFTARLFDLSPKEAAEKLAQDFGLIYDCLLYTSRCV